MTRWSVEGTAVAESTVALLALLVLAWATVSGALARRNITGPLVFVFAGYVAGNPDWGPLPIEVESASIHTVAELTLALVLFSDATRVNVTNLRTDIGLPARLLVVGLPLSVLLGAFLAGSLLAGLPWALAGFVGAALAPTDAALSAQVINDRQIPMRLRRALNVESGLNDGIATPIVTFMVAVAAGQLGVTSEGSSYDAGVALRELGAGVAVGCVLGLLGAAAITFAVRRRWTATGGRRLATLATAVAAFAIALALDGNGFIAAFVAGITFGATVDEEVVDLEVAGELPELGGELLALVVWFLFGAVLVPIAFGVLDVAMVLYALASLTLVRMLPVALGLMRSGLDRASVGFLGWFGPRGLASVVFALVALEELGGSALEVERAVGAVALTVFLSVVLHGITAGPGGRRYVQHEQAIAHEGSPPRSRASVLTASPARQVQVGGDRTADSP